MRRTETLQGVLWLGWLISVTIVAASDGLSLIVRAIYVAVTFVIALIFSHLIAREGV